MKAHTTDFKNTIKELGREIDSKISYQISGVSIELGKEQINSVTPHYESSLLKSVMKQLDIDSNIYIPPETVINYQFGLLVNGAYEYLDYGNYVVDSIERQEDTKSWKITCYDKMLYAMKPYESLGITYPITIKNYLQAICTKLGLTLGSNDFVNANKEITSELYLDGEGNSLEYTYRDVLDEIAQATASVICINENDELEVRYPQNVGEYETQEGTGLSIENVDDVNDFSYELNGNTIQNGTPTPTSPIAVETVTGRQDITVNTRNYLNNEIVRQEQAQYRYITESTIPTGKKLTYTSSTASTTQFLVYAVMDLSNYVGKTIRFRTNFTVSGTNRGRFAIGLCNPDGTNRSAKSTISTSGSTASFTVPTLTGQQTFLLLNLYVNTEQGTVNANDYIEFTNMMLTIDDSDMTYEAFNGNTYEINLGKNLFDKDSFDWVRNNNANYTNTTDTSTNRIRTQTLLKLEGGVTYTISGIPSGTTLNAIKFYSSPSDTSQTSYVQTSTFTVPSNAIYVIIQLAGTNFDSSTNSLVKNANIQIEKGSQATSYSEYKTPIELCKIGDYKDFIRKGTGKNLFNYTTATFSSPSRVNMQFENNVITMTTTGAYTSNDLFFRTKIPDEYLEDGASYTLSSINVSGVAQSLKLQLRNKDESNAGKTASDTVVFDDTYSLFIVGNIFATSSSTSIPSGTVAKICNVQVEKSNQATEYEPYNYKDKWYLYKAIGKYTFDGSSDENWSYLNAYNNNYLYQALGVSLPVGNYSSNYLCSHTLPNSTTSSSSTLGSYFYNSVFRMRVPSTIATTRDDFNTWLASNNVEVYYVLATPTATEITDTELINQLESVRLLQGLNNVSIVSSNLSTPIKMTYLKYFDTIDEEYLKDVNVNFGEKFGPVNSVVLSRSAESDNIYRKDDESVEENGLTEIKIKDNQILNGNNRDEYIDNIFNKLKGLKYYVNDYVSTGIGYLELGDFYKVKVENNSYKCLMLNDELDVTQGLEEPIHAERMEDSETDYTKADKTDRKINQAYIIVDKQNQQINSVVQNINTLQTTVNSQGNQIDALGTRITQTVDNITASVTSIQEELNNGVNLVKTTTVTVNDEGLTVATDTSKTTTIMTSDKFAVRSGGKDLAFFGYDDEIGSTKAEMDNLTVTNYFVAGYHRIEKYDIDGEQRTGVFYIGE